MTPPLDPATLLGGLATRHWVHGTKDGVGKGPGGLVRFDARERQGWSDAKRGSASCA